MLALIVMLALLETHTHTLLKPCLLVLAQENVGAAPVCLSHLFSVLIHT